MWKKLKLIQILQKNGLRRSLSPLFANYIAARKKYIQKLLDVSCSSGPRMGLIVIDYGVRRNPTNGLNVSFVKLQTNMVSYSIN